MKLSLKKKKNLAFLLIAMVLFSFVGFLIANRFWLGWLTTTPVYWFSAFVVSVLAIFLLSMVLYVGPVLSRAKHAFRVVFHKIPWSFVSLVVSLGIFLLYRTPVEPAAVGNTSTNFVTIVMGVIVSVLFTFAGLMSYKYGEREDLVLFVIVAGIGILALSGGLTVPVFFLLTISLGYLIYEDWKGR